MKLNGEPWVAEPWRNNLPLPDLPPEGYTYAIDGRTGRPVKTVPAGSCGVTCRDCWPWGEEE